MANEREGRLLATLINVLVAGMSDPSRLSRGRTYARQGAVLDLHVEPGVLTALVQGSRSRPYEVNVHVDIAERFDTTAALVPDRDEVRFSCSCPDWDDPCKHAVAVMIEFAQQIAEQPGELGRWRGEGSSELTARAVVGSRAATSAARPDSTHDVDVALSEPGRAALQAFLGEPAEHPFAPVTALRPPAAAWGELWAEMLADALRVLTHG